MNKVDILQGFFEYQAPWVIEQYEEDGIPDWPARREQWCNYIDSLHRDGDITDKQADMVPPPWVNGD